MELEANTNKDYTQDGTVDLRGRPVLASKTGKWKACAFLLGKSPQSFLCSFNYKSSYIIINRIWNPYDVIRY